MFDCSQALIGDSVGSALTVLSSNEDAAEHLRSGSTTSRYLAALVQVWHSYPEVAGYTVI